MTTSTALLPAAGIRDAQGRWHVGPELERRLHGIANYLDQEERRSPGATAQFIAQHQAELDAARDVAARALRSVARLELGVAILEQRAASDAVSRRIQRLLLTGRKHEAEREHDRWAEALDLQRQHHHGRAADR